MLTLNITDIRSEALKAKLDRIGLKNSRATSDEFRKHIGNLVELVHDAPSEDDVRSRIKDFFVDADISSREKIVLGKKSKDKKGTPDISISSRNGKYVASIVEVKQPSNDQMLKQDDGNRKALHELVLYFMNEVYLDDQIHNRNMESLIATNGLQWFIFSAKDFYRIFGSRTFLEKYEEFLHANYGDSTDEFYETTKKYLDKTDVTIPCTYVDLSNLNSRDSMIAKNVLSQQFILGGTKEKDSNDINKKFYDELLHIMGLQEYKDDDNKLVIGRKKNPDKGSLLELAIEKLDDKYPFEETYLNEELEDYGKGKQEQLFNLAVELCLMWVNRILFLKLLETSLISYKKENRQFLNISTIPDFQSLYNLFFKVMGVPLKSRNEEFQQKFSQIPYLNSSLFELSKLERTALVIGNLGDKELPLFSKTVLKNRSRKKENLHTLEYLFEFLNAYKFGDDSDCTINASVLGKVFEKINGYKDGSVYTPGYITAYMCKDSINAAILAKFSDQLQKQIGSIDELRNMIDCWDFDKKEDLVSIFNSVTLCDISVGSGHYLVSALNYFLYLKWDLGLFFDTQKRNLRRFKMELKDDSLRIYRGAEELKYDFNDSEAQLLQETLFEEKKRLLENNLFGVDINPNSVNICRLRLWIELLKNAYYKGPEYTELQTLPNVDLNVKRGDSLLSKIPVAIYGDIDASASGISEEDVKEYKKLAKKFKNTDDKDIKVQLTKSIGNLKFKIRGDYIRFFEFSEEYKKQNEEIEKNDAYRHSLEWMFEFPELVNSKGQFTGFDIVIGNPPYINLEKIKDAAKIYGDLIQNKIDVPVYSTFCKGGDIYTLFVERAYALVGKNGIVSYIMPNKWMTTDYGKGLRKFFLEKGIDKIIDFGDYQVFPNVTTYTCIFSKYGKENRNEIKIANVDESEKLNDAVYENFSQNYLSENAWIVSSIAENRLITRLESDCTTLESTIGDNFYYGIKCGCVSAFLIDKEKRDNLVNEHPSAAELLKPMMKGDGQVAWEEPCVNKYLVAIPKGFSNNRYGNHNENEMWELFQTEFPSIANWLNQHEKAKTRGDKGDFWWELRACSYYDKFSLPRIMYQTFQTKACFTYNEEDLMCDNSMWLLSVPNKSLLTILNSKMGWWLICKKCPFIQGGRQLIWEQFKNIPIPHILPDNLSEIADEILNGRKNGIDTKQIEDDADKKVYEAYGLTPDEIATVEAFSEKEALKRTTKEERK